MLCMYIRMGIGLCEMGGGPPGRVWGAWGACKLRVPAQRLQDSLQEDAVPCSMDGVSVWLEGRLALWDKWGLALELRYVEDA